VTIDCTTQDDAGRLVARITGKLGMAETTRVRVHLLKCLAEQPTALLVDLSGLRVSEPLALSVFTAVVRQAARWPGTPVLLCAPQPEAAELFGAAAYRRLPVFDSLDVARDRLGDDARSLPTVAEDLLPTRGAAWESRNLATDACLRWDLPELVAPASLICSELVSNAVDHAGTMMRLRLSLGQKHLFIALRDGSPAEPVVTDPGPGADRGRGLLLVGTVANSWGFLPASDGKVVWASLLVGAG
jgi:anti-anti-sigma regulatory factor